MTCIVGLAEKGRVLLAGDSAGVSLESQEVYTLANPKVFRSGPYALGFTTSFRLGQILRYQTELPEPEGELEAFMTTRFVDTLRQVLENAGFERSLGSTGSILVGIKGRLFTIGVDLQVMWNTDSYAAVGSGRHLAYGALYALASTSTGDPRARAEIALRAAQAFTPSVREPFHFVEA